MLGLVIVLAVLATAAAVGMGWRRFSRISADRVGDARSSVTPVPDGTIRVVVTNPGTQPIVVTAFARPVGSLAWWGRRRVRRSRSQREQRNSWFAFRHLLGSVPPGGESTWIVVAEARHPLCRVVLSLYQSAGRVRVHEALVPATPLVGRRLGWRDRLRTVPASR